MQELLIAFTHMFQPWHLFFLVLGTMLGLIVGVLPGLGGSAGLALVLPFVFGMDPEIALAMMIGLLAPTTTSDTFPAVLMGIPGTSGSQATVVDGFPLAKKGEGARALGAAFTASLFGGIFGAIVLTGAIFIAVPIILAVGFGEQMILVLIALTMVGVLTGTSALKGMATCGIGLILGTIGAAPATAELRLTFGQLYLYEGLHIVIVGLAMFAMPEIVNLLRTRETISDRNELGKGWKEGFLDAFRHWWIVLRCSVIGCIVGALPGLGGSVVDWIAYGHVVQTSKDRSNFGKGDIRGVLAPESANNAKEGGALIPTLLFGIPGSGSMAILLGGFVLIGIEPGVDLVSTDLNLAYTMIWSLALANVIGAGICLFLAQPVARLTLIPYALLGPVMLVIIFFAAFQATRSWGDIIALFSLGLLGIVLKRFGWPRPALLIGFFLAPRLEASSYQALQVYGLSFMERWGAIILFTILIFSIIAAIRFKPDRPDDEQMETVHGTRTRWLQIGVTVCFIGVAVMAIVDGVQRKFLAMVFPVGVGVMTLGFLAPVLWSQLRTRGPNIALYDTDSQRAASVGSIIEYVLWIVGLLGAVAVLGFPIAMVTFIFVFTSVKADFNWKRNGLISAGAMTCLGLLAYFLTLRYPPGLLQRFVEMPWWLGG
ncbi:MAG: putative tricarboxylic transport membrane protein [Alphaproteobacteria bacterium]|jgi:putative tricarboxylic transport membrane protein